MGERKLQLGLTLTRVCFSFPNLCMPNRKHLAFLCWTESNYPQIIWRLNVFLEELQFQVHVVIWSIIIIFWQFDGDRRIHLNLRHKKTAALAISTVCSSPALVGKRRISSCFTLAWFCKRLVAYHFSLKTFKPLQIMQMFVESILLVPVFL